MLPYPSGEPHVGHLKVYSVGDAVAHYARRSGYRVIHPMGYDAFGLPAENHAIKTGEHPRASTDAAIAEFQRQFRRWGSRSTGAASSAPTSPPTTAGPSGSFSSCSSAGSPIARRRPSSGAPRTPRCWPTSRSSTGAASAAGPRSRFASSSSGSSGSPTTRSACSTDLDAIDWPEHVKTMQRNWIGRSEGAEVIFRCEELGIDYPVFTTRPDTLFGATFFVVAPEHPDVFRLAAGTADEQRVREYVSRAMTESAEERGAEDREKTGVPLGRTVTNPVNGEEFPSSSPTTC